MKPYSSYKILHPLFARILCLLLFMWATLVHAEITITTTDVTGCKEADGKAVITVTPGGDYDFEYSVDGGAFQASNSFQDLAKGSHMATVRDKKTSCQYSKPFEINGFNKLGVSVSGFGTTQFCQGTAPPSVTLTAAGSGGSGDYSYSWPGGTLTVSSSGSFSVTVTDNQTGCQETVGGEVLIIPVVCSKDPNDIIGPVGYGPGKMISKFLTHPYIIRFENDPAFATAPAQVVKITHPLDKNVNPLSLRLGEFGFANHTFQVPQNRTSYSIRLDVLDSLGVVVDVTAGIDVTKREAFWIFESKDPTTGLPPTNALLGFLPINDSSGIGEGFVSYTIKPATGTVTGDTIFANADIVFDINAAIATPTIYNTIDAVAPTSQVQTIVPTTILSTVKINWSGKDDVNGAGIRDYALYVSEEGSPFLNYKSGLTDTTTIFAGSAGKNYSFYILATDHTGNQEILKTVGEASIQLEADSSNAPTFLLKGQPISAIYLPTCFQEGLDTCIKVIDIDGDSIIYKIIKNTSHFSSSIKRNPLGVCLNTRPMPLYTGQDTLYISACDTKGLCDTLNVKLYAHPPLQTAVITQGPILIGPSNASGYQWIQCIGNETYTVVPNETTQSFTSSISGSYAVIISKDGCSDTSTCQSVVINSSEKELALENNISLFPNPTTGKVRMNLTRPLEEIMLEVINHAGKVVYKNTYRSTTGVDIDLSKFALGIYEIKVQSITKIAIFKVVKQ